MRSDLIVLDNVDALERVIVASDARLVLLFKHSVTCGTSAQAHDELREHLSKAQHNAQYAIVTVQTHRDVYKYIVNLCKTIENLNTTNRKSVKTYKTTGCEGTLADATLYLPLGSHCSTKLWHFI